MPEPEAVPAPPPGPRYFVQVGALEDRALAESTANRLSHQFHRDGLVLPLSRSDGSTLYRVRLHAESRADAAALARQLRQQKRSVWIVREE